MDSIAMRAFDNDAVHACTESYSVAKVQKGVSVSGKLATLQVDVCRLDVAAIISSNINNYIVISSRRFLIGYGQPEMWIVTLFHGLVIRLA